MNRNAPLYLNPNAYIPNPSLCDSSSEVQIRTQDQDQDDRRRDDIDGAPTGAGQPSLFVGHGPVGQAGNLGVVRRRRQIADDMHDRDAHHEDHHAVVLEKEIVDNPEE